MSILSTCKKVGAWLGHYVALAVCGFGLLGTIAGFSLATAAGGGLLQGLGSMIAGSQMMVSGPQGMEVGKPMPTLNRVSADTVRNFKLEPLAAVKRPSDSATSLSEGEQNYCALKMLTGDITSMPQVCLMGAMSGNLGDMMMNSTVLRVLSTAHDQFAGGNSSVSSQVFDSFWQSAKSEASGAMLGKKCVEMGTVNALFVSMTNYGFPIDKANQGVDLFNSLCAGKTLDFETDQQTGMEIAQRITELTKYGVQASIANWDPQTFLPPKSGSASQQKPEIAEAQKLLKQLGYYQGAETGEVDSATAKAIEDFEYNLGQKKTGQLTFANLMQLRLFTTGFETKHIIK